MIAARHIFFGTGGTGMGNWDLVVSVSRGLFVTRHWRFVRLCARIHTHMCMRGCSRRRGSVCVCRRPLVAAAGAARCRQDHGHPRAVARAGGRAAQVGGCGWLSRTHTHTRAHAHARSVMSCHPMHACMPCALAHRVWVLCLMTGLTRLPLARRYACVASLVCIDRHAHAQPAPQCRSCMELHGADRGLRLHNAPPAP